MNNQPLSTDTNDVNIYTTPLNWTILTIFSSSNYLPRTETNNQIQNPISNIEKYKKLKKKKKKLLNIYIYRENKESPLAF